jgi:hypothetical protein
MKAEVRALLGPLERANLNTDHKSGSVSVLICLLPHLKTETDPVSETLSSLVYRIPDDGQSPKNPVTLKCYTQSSEPFRIYLNLLFYTKMKLCIFP